MKKHVLLTIIAVSLIFVSCEKEPGEGGMGTICGTVYIEDYNYDFTIHRGTYPAQDYDVFIIYGNDEYFSDKLKTSYNGYFEFEYLREGDYTIFAYSKDKELDYNVTSELIPVMREVSITSRKQTVTVDTLFVVK